MQRDLSTEQHLAELGEAARRAGAIVTEHINSIVEGAERHAERILADANADAERTRRDAIDSAQRLLTHLHALERPLGQLVANLQSEMDRVVGELESGSYVDAQATAIGSGSAPAASETEAPPEEPQTPGVPEVPVEEPVEPEPADEPEAAEEPAVEPEPEPAAVEPEPEPAAVEPEPEPAAVEPEPEPAAVEPEPEPAAAEPEAPAAFQAEQPAFEQEQPPVEPEPPPPVERKRRGLFGRLRRSGDRTFVSIQGYCAVCQRAFMAGSQENLELSGWLVSGDIGLCPECQSEGWQLPEGARLPFRRGGS
jgi:hypothetical protein